MVPEGLNLEFGGHLSSQKVREPVRNNVLRGYGIIFHKLFYKHVVVNPIADATVLQLRSNFAGNYLNRQRRASFSVASSFLFPVFYASCDTGSTSPLLLQVCFLPCATLSLFSLKQSFDFCSSCWFV